MMVWRATNPVINFLREYSCAGLQGCEGSTVGPQLVRGTVFSMRVRSTITMYGLVCALGNCDKITETKKRLSIGCGFSLSDTPIGCVIECECLLPQ